MKPDFAIIANPTSGVRAAPEMATAVSELLRKHGKTVELKLTTAAGDAKKFAAELARDGVGCVVGCGGDGTLQEIASSLEGTATAFGIIPRGRCNDFARALGIFTRDTAERLAHTLVHGKKIRADVGCMGEKRFLTVATLGFDSEVSRFVETRKLWVRGTAAYLYGVMRVLFTFKQPVVKLTGDFGVIEDRMLLVATGNCDCYGGAMKIAPGAKLDDGVFQLCVIKEAGKLEVLRVLPAVMKGRHIDHPKVRMLSTSFVHIETPGGPQWICADGETLGQTPCKLEVKRGALTVIAPD